MSSSWRVHWERSSTGTHLCVSNDVSNEPSFIGLLPGSRHEDSIKRHLMVCGIVSASGLSLEHCTALIFSQRHSPYSHLSISVRWAAQNICKLAGRFNWWNILHARLIDSADFSREHPARYPYPAVSFSYILRSYSNYLLFLLDITADWTYLIQRYPPVTTSEYVKRKSGLLPVAKYRP
jgi:hypothetical protein